MRIIKTRIRSVAPYLANLGENVLFYVGLRNTIGYPQVLEKYGFVINRTEPQIIVPRTLGPISKFNADGKWEVHRDLPKEPREFEREYRCIDWHGEEHTGICFQTRYCYQRTRIMPPLIELEMERNLVKSPLLRNDGTNYDEITHIINLFLEMFHECEILLEQQDANFRQHTDVRNLLWTILPAGRLPWEQKKEQMKEIFDIVSRKHRTIISNRHEIIWNYEPDFIARGEQGFWGYIVYAFPQKELFVFECNNIDNATYIFRGNWESASTLTKAEILSEHLHEARIIHNSTWHDKINVLLR